MVIAVFCKRKKKEKDIFDINNLWNGRVQFLREKKTTKQTPSAGAGVLMMLEETQTLLDNNKHGDDQFLKKK